MKRLKKTTIRRQWEMYDILKYKQTIDSKKVFVVYWVTLKVRIISAIEGKETICKQVTRSGGCRLGLGLWGVFPLQLPLLSSPWRFFISLLYMSCHVVYLSRLSNCGFLVESTPLSLSPYIYIYMYIYIYIYTYISLSLYIYIYIHTWWVIKPQCLSMFRFFSSLDSKQLFDS